MKKIITYQLLITLLSVVVFPSFAQQNQNTTHQEIETLKKQVSELQKQLQTVENAEKMELAAKLAEAQAKLGNAEFGKFERELRDANDEWLKSWSNWFTVILGTFVVILLGVAAVFWFWLSMKANQLIADRVEKSLNGFKEAMGQVDILKNQIKEAQDQMDPLKNQIRVLKKENAISVLRSGHVNYDPNPTCSYPKKIKVLSEETLLDVFGDEMCKLTIRSAAAQVLTHRQSTRLLSPLLKLLNTLLDSEFDMETGEEWNLAKHREWELERAICMGDLVSCLEYIPMQETYEGLTKFLSRLLSMEDSEERNSLLTVTLSSLTHVIFKLDKRDLVPELRKAIKEFLIHLTDRQDVDLDLEESLLNLLEKHDPDFVEEWRVKKATANTENEESS